MGNYNLGLVSVSFRKHLPKEIISAMKKTNLSCIEWGSDIHAPCHDMQRLYELVRLQEEYGIYCSSYGTYFRLGVTDVDELEKYIYAAKILGTKTLRIWCGDKRANLYSDIEKNLFLQEAKKAAEIAENFDVTLCAECHNNSYTETLEGALGLMKAVNSEHFGMYWQPNQFVDFETNTEYAKNISAFVRNIHVFNWQGNNKHPLKSAAETWKKYLSYFDESQNLLLEFMPDDDINSLEKEAESLRIITQNT